ncbi:hypothetical protein [Cryobacterium sp. N21]|uniref:hypothetical protein n=1 Tax=Cryobacterium sp. N21 TaxID=2048289 RepID=UPI001124E15D|nr:hypothetical protein [Cryobacterium sp. N21]
MENNSVPFRSLDQNAYLGSADTLVAVLAGILFFLLGLGIVAAIGRRMLGTASPGVLLYISLVAIGCLVTAFFGPFFLAPDGPIYDAQAHGFASDLRNERNDIGLTNGKEGWPILLGSVYYVFGRVTFVGVIINCLATASSAVFVARTAQIISGTFSSKKMYLWYVCTPLFAVLGPSLMREALCWLGISMICYALASLWNGRIGRLWIGGAGLFIFGTVRTSLAILVLCALILGLLIVVLIRKKMRLTLTVTSVISVIIASTALSVALDSLGVTEESLQLNRVYISVDATTGFAASSLQPGVGGFLTMALQVFPRLVLGPFLWEFGLAPVWVWVGANSIAWLAILYIAIRSIRRMKDGTIGVILLAASGLLLLAMSVSLTNYGIVVRMRGSTMIMLLPLVISQGRNVKLQAHRQRYETLPRALKLEREKRP